MITDWTEEVEIVEQFCGMCNHTLKDNNHGFDQNDAYLNEENEVCHYGSCTYCKYCNPRVCPALPENKLGD